MRIGEKQRDPKVYLKSKYGKRLALWGVLMAGLAAGYYFYYFKREDNNTNPLFALTVLIGVAVLLFFLMKLNVYYFSSPFSGVLVSKKVHTTIRSDSTAKMTSATLGTYTAVDMIIDTDAGGQVQREYLMRTRGVNPYAEGDHVAMLRGAPFLCRFPRGNDGDNAEGRSVVCPICGSVAALGTEQCFDCGLKLPTRGECDVIRKA